MGDVGVTAVVSGLVAGVVAILASVAVERFGGAFGGVLGALPTTVVPAAVGMALVGGSGVEVRGALFAVPAGMVSSGIFLLQWRLWPSRLCCTAWPARLSAMVCVSLLAWAATAFPLWLLLQASSHTPGAVESIGCMSLVATIALGLLLILRFPTPAPAGRNPVPFRVLLLRGAFAAVSIGLAVFVGSLQPALGGILSTFPAIFLTTMLAVAIAQGETVSIGAVGPLILCSSAVSAFAMLFALLYPPVGIPGATPLAWILAVLLTSLPATLLLRRIHQPNTDQPQNSTALELSQLSQLSQQSQRHSLTPAPDDAFSTEIESEELKAIEAGGVMNTSQQQRTTTTSPTSPTPSPSTLDAFHTLDSPTTTTTT